MPSATLEGLYQILEASMPRLSPAGRKVLRELVMAKGLGTGADSFAQRLGFRDRHQLAYRLRREGLLPLQTLSRWIRIMVWLVEHESGGASLCSLSLRDARDPAYRYRLVKELLGVEWSSVEKRGFTWLLLKFIEACRCTEGHHAHSRQERSRRNVG